MMKWIIVSAALAILILMGVAGCGAKMPTVSEESQGDPYEQKLQVHMEYTGTSYDVIRNAD